MGIEKTQLTPEHWGGSNWSGHTDPFCEAAYDMGAAAVTPFSRTTRYNLEEAYARLGEFLLAYSEELERKHLRYADIRGKTAAMKAIVAG